MRSIRVFEAIIWVRKKILRTSNIHNQAAWSAFIPPKPYNNELFRSSIWQKAYPKAFSNLLSHFNGPWCDWWSLVTATPPKRPWDGISGAQRKKVRMLNHGLFLIANLQKKTTQKSLNGTHTHMHHVPWIFQCQHDDGLWLGSNGFCIPFLPQSGQVFCGKLPPIFQSLESQYEISLNMFNSPMTGPSNEHE